MLFIFMFKILGIVCVGIIGNNYDQYRFYNVQDQFFFLMTTTFMIATFILLLSCLVSLSTESIISKTIYVRIYMFFFIFIFPSLSITFVFFEDFEY